MAAITASVTIPAPIDEVWAEVAAIERHPEWMKDARSLRFLTEHTRGQGTRIAVETRVGPLRTTDVMEFTEWKPPHTMAVVHRGLVGGSGRFSLEEAPGGATAFRWREELEFPWWFGGPVGAWMARPILSRIWRSNLERLRDRF